MANIDELFKRPPLPSQKRKPEALKEPNQVYKQAKLNGSSDVKQKGKATGEDGKDDGEDGFAGPELPLELEGADDEEGRFFGGGVNKDTVQVLNYIDAREMSGEAKPEKIDAAWIRKIALNFEKRISKNAELRAKFEGEPQKFMGSEADLDADIKALSALSDHPNLYDEFVRLGCVASLVSLLAHENTDIAIDAIEIINELIDEDVEAQELQWQSLVDAMLEADLLNLLFQNISRLDESIESDNKGVYHILEVLDSLSSKAPVAEILGKTPLFMNWLLRRAVKKEHPVGQNKQYAAEVLAVLVQASPSSRARFIEQEDGIDSCLQALSSYRKRDPVKGSEEEEFVENIFDCLACSIDDAVGKEKFLDAEGVELCLIMVKEGKMSRPRALRLLDHALAGPDGGAAADRLVEAAGLKATFSLFMKNQDAEVTEHILGILSSMLRLLPAESTSRIRLLGKFVEKDYEKIARLLVLRREYSRKLDAVDQELEEERQGLSKEEQEEVEDVWLIRRLDAGLYQLQMINVILAWLVAEDDGAKTRICQLLADRDENLGSVKKSLENQMDGMNAEDTESIQRDMLSTLVKFLV